MKNLTFQFIQNQKLKLSRFDFTNKGAMTVNQVKDAEQASKDLILKNDPVYAKEANLATAKTIKGLRAVFEETYPDPVRIVSVGKTFV